MKYLLVLLLASTCYADGWVVCSVRTSDGAASWHCDQPTSSTAQLDPPPSGCTWQAFPKTAWTATNQDAGDGVLVLSLSAGRIVNRGAGLLAADRALVAKIAAKLQFLAWRQVLTGARQALAVAPGDAFLQSQVSAAASRVTSYASQASIPVTTATTQ